MTWGGHTEGHTYYIEGAYTRKDLRMRGHTHGKDMYTEELPLGGHTHGGINIRRGHTRAEDIHMTWTGHTGRTCTRGDIHNARIYTEGHTYGGKHTVETYTGRDIDTEGHTRGEDIHVTRRGHTHGRTYIRRRRGHRHLKVIQMKYGKTCLRHVKRIHMTRRERAHGRLFNPDGCISTWTSCMLTNDNLFIFCAVLALIMFVSGKEKILRLRSNLVRGLIC